MIRNNQRRRRGGGGSGPRPQQMAGGNNYGARLDNRQRGNATQLLEKYRALARDAQQAGDRVTAEYYLQYAEHYFRILGDYRDRQPEGRRVREGYDDEGVDSETETAEVDDDRADDADDRRDERRDDRERGRRDDRNRDSRQRDDRQRDDRGEGGRRDWQRDRRERRPDRSEQGRAAEAGEAHADERESLLQALPPPVARGEGRRLSMRRDPPDSATEAEAPATEAPSAADDQTPRRRIRTRKPAAEAESAE